VGGSGADAFRIDAASGQLAPTSSLRWDSGEQTLLVTASDGRLTSEPELITLRLPQQAAPCFGGKTLLTPRPGCRSACTSVRNSVAATPPSSRASAMTASVVLLAGASFPVP